MNGNQDDMTKYCQCMEDIKRRVSLIRNYINGGHSLGSEEFDYELISLHLRKILELIAFASLTAHKEKYSQAHEKYIREWRTTRLIENIAKLNPNFYPLPFQSPQTLSNGTKHFPASDKPFLKLDEFNKLLNLCSDVLHVWNPYSLRERKIDFGVRVSEWIDKIQWLLDIHRVQLADSGDVWVVVMSDYDGKAHAYYCANAGLHTEYEAI